MEQVISDNGPQYSSLEFSRFIKRWDFEHLSSSPGHSQSNGKAKSAVKTAKRMLQTATDAGTDPYMALLDVRNTLPQNTGTSPAPKMMNRQTLTLLQAIKELLRPQILDGKHTKEVIQETHYNKTARDLHVDPLKEGDTVRIPFIKHQKTEKRALLLNGLMKDHMKWIHQMGCFDETVNTCKREMGHTHQNWR